MSLCSAPNDLFHFANPCRFAAEIFQELHDEIMAIGIRGQDLKARVGRLETDLPAVEKTLLSESSQIDFAYSIRGLKFMTF